MMGVLFGWLVLVGGIIWASAYLWDRDKEIGAQSRVKDQWAGSAGNEDMAFARGALEGCGQTLFRFLQARTPEERSQFIRKPLEAVGRMSRFYNAHPAVTMAPEELALDKVGVLHFGEERAMATAWKVADGRLIEAVFFKEDQEWRLDWEHFVRFSDHPWTFFLNGDGPAAGEFRVLARERLAHDRRNTSEIGIVCYAPRFGSPTDADAPSPEFLLDRNSETGRVLVAAFQDRAANRKPFGDTATFNDPDEMIRLRIRVRREPTNEGFRFVLEKVSACHWISVDDLGVTPVAAKPAEAAQ